VERVIVPDSCILLDFILGDMTKIIDNLLVYPEHMERNLNLTHGLIFSQEVLLALTKKGMKREDAYRMVQEQAMQVWKEGKDFKELLLASDAVKPHLTKEELDNLFDARRSLKHLDYMFERVGL
ncbi:MAG TPA: adenylosuccinate lyase, partial [Bacteroidota bacterium]|nr:adenylosuccinate lyase [Bacteroidota bacterium]